MAVRVIIQRWVRYAREGELRRALEQSRNIPAIKTLIGRVGEDRARLVAECEAAVETRVLVTHGTDTMVETAGALAAVAERQHGLIGFHQGITPALGAEDIARAQAAGRLQFGRGFYQ